MIRLHGTMKDLVAQMVEIANVHVSPKRGGGWFTVAYADVKQPLRFHTIERIGSFSVDKDKLYRDRAQEKARRLHNHPEHKTSRESRNESRGQYGGAIRACKDDQSYIFSFSGFPEIWDEAFMLFLALNFNYIQTDEVIAIANEEGHELTECLRKLRRSL